MKKGLLQKIKDSTSYTATSMGTGLKHHVINRDLLKFEQIKNEASMMLVLLQDWTGVDPKDISFDDERILSLFQNTEALGITPDQIGGTVLGCLGFPEFGADYAMSVLTTVKVKSFSDLIKVQGLMHGVGVWLENAKDLIKSGTAELDACISSCDSGMLYLTERGIDRHLAYEIMESVRRGKGLTNEMEKVMRKVKIPEWYLVSCKKIQYLFPKANAAANAMLEWRIAYYKLYYPQAFYEVWFLMHDMVIRRKKLLSGADDLMDRLAFYRTKPDLTSAEENEYEALRMVEEMYARGRVFEGNLLRCEWKN